MTHMPGNRYVTNVCRVAGHAVAPAFRTMRGVTLIELLVVMVLIGAVLMVTMPVFFERGAITGGSLSSTAGLRCFASCPQQCHCASGTCSRVD